MYVHIACLKNWIQVKGAIECEICHSLYQQQWIDWAFEQNYLKKDQEDEDEDD